MTIRKALITAAGFGTRFLPITKTIQKEMLPILNRPLVDYVVEDCVRAGIEEIIFVISEHNMQLIHYYRENKRLENYLQDREKQQLYNQVKPLHQKATFTFVRQPDAAQYGTAVPVELAKEHLQSEEAFLVFMGDDFIFNQNQTSEAKKMIELFQQSDASALATCLPKSTEVLHKYGIAEVQTKNNFTYLQHLVEKPAPGMAPSNLANISKYIFTPEIFEIIADQETNQKSGELYITDSITTLAQQKDVVIYTPTGEYLDGGYVAGWLKANLAVAKTNPNLREKIETYLHKEWNLHK